MSHVTTCEVQIKDLAALEAAADKLGLDFVPDQKKYLWWGQFVGDYQDELIAKLGIDPKDFGKCEHVLRPRQPKNAYEVGVVRNPKGEGYILMYDFYGGGGGLMKLISTDGKTPNRLVQGYAAEVSERQLRKAGYRISRKTVNGRVVVNAVR